MFASTVIGRCKQCKKSGRLKHESASYAWSAARFCQNLWIEGLVEQNATTSRHGIPTAVQQYRGHHNSSRLAISTTRWHGNPNCQVPPISRSITSATTTASRRSSSCDHTWLFPIIQQQRKHSTRAASNAPNQTLQQQQNRKRSGTDIASDREMVLSAALEQSSASTAQSLIDIMFQALRQVNNPKLAWECYTDLTLRNKLHHLTRDQFRELIRLFRHRCSHTESLEYVLTLMDDMASLGYRIGRKEKVVIMRLLGMNGKLDEMEQVFLDIKQDKMLLVMDGDAQKPFNTMFDMYQMQKDVVGSKHVAERSLEIYGEMIELGVRPGPAATRSLMENIRGAGDTHDVVEMVWSWLWNKMGMIVGGNPVDLEPSLYREMVLYFASAGRAEYALEINDLMVKRKIQRDVRVGTALIHKVGRSGNLERAMEIFDEMTRIDGVQPTIVTFNALIDIHAHKSPEPDIEGAGRIYEKLQEYGLKPDIATIGPLIDMFAKKGDVDMVRRLYRDLIDNQQLKPNQHIYSSLIECFVKHKDKESAMNVLQAMRKTLRGGVTMANQVTYNLMIRSFVRDNDLNGAFDLLDLMIESKLQPQSRTFTPILGLLADQGNVVGVNKIMEMMSNIGTRMNIFTHTALLEAYTKAGDIRGAERIFQKMKQRYRLNTQTFNVLMYGYMKKNEMDMVLDIYRHMLKSHVGMNEHTYGILMYYFSCRREPKAVESLLATMKNSNITPRVTCWTILMQSYFQTERYDEGFRVYDRMKQAGIKPSYVTYSLMVATCVRTGDLELAETIMGNAINRYEKHSKAEESRELLANARKMASTEMYTHNLPKLVDELLKERQEQQPPEAKLPPHLFDPLINAYTNRLDFAKAKKTFGLMMDLNVKISATAYVTLMNMYKKEERLDIVDHLWQHLRTRKANPVPMKDLDPEIEKDIPLPVAIKDSTDILFSREDVNSLELSISQQQSDTVSPFALSVYIDTLTQQERFDDLAQLWDELTEEQYPFDEQNWNRYLTSLAESGNVEKASIMTLKYVSEHHENVQPSIRISDNPSLNDDQRRQLHNRTYRALAQMLDISAEGLSDRQLYDTVLSTLETNSL
ncbi:hypothetical protein BDA99DRAFT_562403 [Phascolomyces articulosus]|uniref:PROP1-like PPR domain-containing protein n=1 Tax=Phascolomyces articulosus TaxID=60185 RepID=A0AAD5PBI7_9FUNG|nr:hypothetical protein BDA99DRAFT_562403 [Phascolomyces articulosus]